MHSGRKVVVRTPLDVFEARRVVRQLATLHGFGVRGRQALEIVTSELATNILKHGIEGSLLVERVDHEQSPALRLEASDRGPRIANLETALRDGSDGSGPVDPAKFWGRRGIAAGLGAIYRLSDAFEYEHTAAGNRFVVLVRRDLAERRQPGRLLRGDE